MPVCAALTAGFNQLLEKGTLRAGCNQLLEEGGLRAGCNLERWLQRAFGRGDLDVESDASSCSQHEYLLFFMMHRQPTFDNTSLFIDIYSIMVGSCHISNEIYTSAALLLSYKL